MLPQRDRVWRDVPLTVPRAPGFRWRVAGAKPTEKNTPASRQRSQGCAALPVTNVGINALANTLRFGFHQSMVTIAPGKLVVTGAVLERRSMANLTTAVCSSYALPCWTHSKFARLRAGCRVEVIA